MLGIAAATAVAQEQQLDEKTLLERIEKICEGFGWYFRLPDDARERALEGGLSPEWMTEALESIVRKNLPVLEEIYKDYAQLINGGSAAYKDTRYKIRNAVLVLRYFSGPNTSTVFRECISSTDTLVCDAAIDSYITLEGVNTIPFFREYIAKGGQPRSGICIRLGTLIPGLKEKNKTGEVDKIHAFLLEMIQEEKEWYAVMPLDNILLSTLDGYSQSVQREQTVRRFVHMPNMNERERQHYHTVRAEVDAVPADKRKDFRAKGELLDPERK